MKLPSFFVFFAIAIVLIVAASFVFSQDSTDDKIKVMVYKSPSCGCCGAYSDYLKAKGFDVEVILTDDMNSIKQKYGVPNTLDSCHTSVVEGYFVEGHIPVESINKLLSEKPDIKGIALPNMPSGTPGMPGTKSGLWTIYKINNDGTYGEFEKV
jgi:hypothetical protein